MSKSFSLRWLFIFLVCTVLTGLTFRWQLAGLQWDWAVHLDWRRAHSHLGFYGVLFPLTWMAFQSFGHWSPSRKMWLFYISAVVLAAIAFLWQGYGPLSNGASAAVLGVWLIFAWKNRASLCLNKRDWLGSVSLSVLLAAATIPFVAIASRAHPDLANKLARAFLTVLLFGVFVPTLLRVLRVPAPRSWMWMLATVSASIFLTHLLDNSVFGWGLAWMGASLLKSLFSKAREREDLPWRDLRLKIAWGLFAFSLLAIGSGLLPYTYFLAIAGIHFLILGPLLMSFALIHLRIRPHPWLRVVYESSLITMVLSIALQSWVATSLATLSAVSGTFLVLSLLFILVSSRSSLDDAVDPKNHILHHLGLVRK